MDGARSRRIDRSTLPTDVQNRAHRTKAEKPTELQDHRGWPQQRALLLRRRHAWPGHRSREVALRPLTGRRPSSWGDERMLRAAPRPACASSSAPATDSRGTGRDDHRSGIFRSAHVRRHGTRRGVTMTADRSCGTRPSSQGLDPTRWSLGDVENRNANAADQFINRLPTLRGPPCTTTAPSWARRTFQRLAFPAGKDGGQVGGRWASRLGPPRSYRPLGLTRRRRPLGTGATE